MNSYQDDTYLLDLYRLKSLDYKYIEPRLFHSDSNEIPNDLATFKSYLKDCHLCDLSKSRTQTMLGEGSVDAKLMVVDYSVTLSQDNENRFLSSNFGETLQNMITKVLGLSLDEVYFTHAIKCKALKSEHLNEIASNSCKPFIFKEIEIVKPKIVLALGLDVYKFLSNDNDTLDKIRATLLNFSTFDLFTIHDPRYIIKNPSLKKQIFEDLKLLKSLL